MNKILPLLFLLINSVFAIDSLYIYNFLLPDSLKPKYVNRGEFIKGELDSTYLIKTESKNFFTDDNLSKSGVIYRGFTVDNNGSFKLNSGLDLKIEGEIYKETTLKAVINDSDIPISGSGESESVSNIDNLYLEVINPNFEVRLGNSEYKIENRGVFSNFTRNLSGGYLKGIYRESSVLGMYANSRSSYTSLSFTGTEGYQGPYRLSSKDNINKTLVIVPGSETVYLNGIVMKRGGYNDYLIDYENAEISFTTFRMIKDDDEIIIDFQINDEQYKKDIIFSDLNTTYFNGSFNNKLYYFREVDDIDNPISYVQSGDIKKMLESAGNNPDSSYVIGAVLVGENEGSYNDSIVNGEVFYIWAGENNGDYNVSFSKFNDGFYDREIDYNGRVKYIFNPAGGDYMHFEKIPLPKSKDVVSSFSNLSVGKFDIENELVFTRSIDNILWEDKNDHFNGFGDYTKIGYKSGELFTGDINLGNLSVFLSRKNYNKKFEVAGRKNYAGFEDNLGFDVADSINYTEHGGGFLYNYKTLINLDYNGNYSSIDDSIKSSYNSLKVFGSTNFLHEYNFMVDHRNTENSRSSFNGMNLHNDITYKINKFYVTPYYDYNFELLKTSTTEGNEQNTYSLKTKLVEDDTNYYMTNYSFSDRAKSLGSGYENFSETHDMTFSSDNIWNSSLSSNLFWNRRVTDYAGSDSSDVSVDLIQNNISYNYDDVYTFDINYNASRKYEDIKAKVFYQTEPGEGSYSLINGEYYYDPEGDWDYFVRSSGKVKPLTSVNFNFEYYIDLNEVETSNIYYWMSRLDFDGSVDLEESSTLKSTEKLLFLIPSSFQTDSTVTGNFDFDNSVWINKINRKLYYEYNFLYSQSLSRQYSNEMEMGKRVRHKTGIYSRLESFFIRGYLNWENNKIEYLNSSLPLRDIQKKDYKLIVDYTYDYGLTFGNEVKYGVDRDFNRVEKADYLAYSPEVSYSFLSKGIAKVKAFFYFVDSSEKEAGKLSDGYGDGFSMRSSFSCRYYISEILNFNVEYQFRKLNYEKESSHELTAELRLEF
ncbi:MAG: hypothetical protein JXR48_17595 [Candidatus Delongbacteria bacterium]|nr:hypothetical protein [Candidatus Delongbacteria bacterium]MBN2836772.1 hypothetical protein [Candidatus Delongbacteria bacterium]